LLSLEDSRIPRSSEVITQSQILNPPADVDTLPDRGLASNPIEDTLRGLQSSILSNTRKEVEARGIRDVRVEIASRVQTRADNNARTQPRTNPFIGRPQRGGTIGDSNDLIRNRKYYNDNL